MHYDSAENLAKKNYSIFSEGSGNPICRHRNIG